MIGLCNIPPGSPLFGIDVHSPRPRFDWDNVPSSSFCERFEQRQNNVKTARKMLRYLRDGRKVWEEKVTEPQSSDFCWKQTLFRSRLIVHTKEILTDSSREQQPKQHHSFHCFRPSPKVNRRNASLLERLSQRKSRKTQMRQNMPKSGELTISSRNASYWSI